jgi:murein tripeptide amidase MpaA
MRRVRALSQHLREPEPSAPAAWAVRGAAGASAVEPADGPSAESALGSHIGSWVYGSGAQTVLILGGIHGNEPAGPTLCEALQDHLASHPEALAGRRVVVAPALNPDGLLANTRENSREVDLNRNFDTANRQASTVFGSAPLSEPESRFVVELIEKFLPAAIVSVHQPLACVDYDGPAQELAAAMSRACGLPVEKLVDSKPYPGSLGSYAGVDRSIPIVTLELPGGDVSAWSKAALWEEYGAAMLEAVRLTGVIVQPLLPLPQQPQRAAAASPPVGGGGGFAIDAAFPGGNILVSSIVGDTVTLGPDLRDTTTYWFYWYFRVAGASGRTLTFEFGEKDVGARGPGVSLDAGRTWAWLGAEAVSDGSFAFTFPGRVASRDGVRFSMGMPYLRADWDECLSRHTGNPFVQIDTLTTTSKDRDVPVLRIGDRTKTAPYAVAITGRHHCCEMMASYAVEGIVETALASDATGCWLRMNAEFLVLPFMDTDGVEDGDQGKNRAPHDHNRDYAAEPRYPEVAALKELLPAWSAGRPLVFLDLHDPYITGGVNETVHFLEPEQRDMAAHMDVLCTHLERDQQGPIAYRKADNLAFGDGYNVNKDRPSPMAAGWAKSLPNTVLGCTAEIAYANAGGCEVNTHSARELGRDIATALASLLREL